MRSIARGSTRSKIGDRLVDVLARRDQRRRDLDHRVAAVVLAADQALVEQRVRQEVAQQDVALLGVNVSRVARSLTSSMAQK